MTFVKLNELFEKQGEVRFKLYSLEYIIKKIDNKIIVHPILYENRKSFFNSFEEVLSNYTIYNENIIENIDKVIII